MPATSSPSSTPETLTPRLRRLGIDSYRQRVVYLRTDSPVCRSEGFETQARIEVSTGPASIIAVLNVVSSAWLGTDEVGLSEDAWIALGAAEGTPVHLRHPQPLESLSDLRAKAYGQRLGQPSMRRIVNDIASGRYSDVHLASFVTACAGDRLDLGEVIALTQAMVDAGDCLEWGHAPVVDKHCVGGLPGNRTTLLVVPIVTSLGLTMPKTSSRAITSPHGTADTMETLAPVDLDLVRMRRVVEREGGCIAWGGHMRLSPADDFLVRVERALDLDSEGQLVASILSKKRAAGSQMVVIDMPVGATAKVRSANAARTLGATLEAVGRAVGLDIRVLATDGSQPVGRGIGPALEARDVLAVLQRQPDAPADLRNRALVLAGRVLELASAADTGAGFEAARAVLDDGRAWDKFQRICDAQGGMREPTSAPLTSTLSATRAGIVTTIDNRTLSRVGKLAGAPRDPSAGVVLHSPIGTRLEQGQPLFTVHAESRGELSYALEFVAKHPDIVLVGNE